MPAPSISIDLKAIDWQSIPRSAIEPFQDLSLRDPNMLHLSTTIIRARANFYRLLTIIRTDSYLQIIDPSCAMRGYTRSITPNCGHKDDSAITELPSYIIRLEQWNIDAMTGGLDTSSMNETDENQSILIALTVLDSNLKVNLALSLFKVGSVLRTDRCCLQCAIDKAQEICSRIRRPDKGRIINLNICKRLLSDSNTLGIITR